MRIRTAFIPEFRAIAALRRTSIHVNRLPMVCRAEFPVLPCRAMTIAQCLRTEIHRVARKPTGDIRIIDRKLTGDVRIVP